VDAEDFFAGQIWFFARNSSAELLLVRRQRNFHFVRRDFFLRADEGSTSKLFDGMARIILRQRAGDKPTIKPVETVVFMADPHRRAGEKAAMR